MSNVPPKDWDPPEHLSLSEREFLVDRAETINGIIAASYLQVGQVLLQIKRKFKRDPDLNGWFGKWVDECTPINTQSGLKLAQIAELAEEDPQLLEAAKTTASGALYKITCLPGEAREKLLAEINQGAKVSASDVMSLKDQPEIQLAAARETVEELEMKLLDLDLELQTASSDSYQRLQSNKSKTKQRLNRVLAKLKVKEDEVESLGKERSTQDLVLQTLRKQLKQKEVVIENMSLDPEQKRKRALAQTVVDATKGLDLLLSSIDRYGTDKPELGLEAINTIERKMDEVKSKLLEHYADLSETGGSS